MKSYSLWGVLCVSLSAYAMDKNPEKLHSFVSFDTHNNLIVNKDVFVQRFNDGKKYGVLMSHLPDDVLSSDVIKLLASFYVVPQEVQNYIKYYVGDAALRYMRSQSTFLPHATRSRTVSISDCTLAISTDGMHALVKTDGQQLWHIDLKKKLHMQEANKFSLHVLAAALHNDTTLYGLCNGQLILKFPYGSKDTYNTIRETNTAIEAVALSDYFYAATNSRGRAWVFDRNTQQTLPLCVLDKQAVQDIALSEERLFSARQDKFIFSHDIYAHEPARYVYKTNLKPESLCVRYPALIIGLSSGDCEYIDLRYTKKPVCVLSGKPVFFNNAITAVGITDDYDVLAGSFGGIAQWSRAFNLNNEFKKLSLPEAYALQTMYNKAHNTIKKES